VELLDERFGAGRARVLGALLAELAGVLGITRAGDLVGVALRVGTAALVLSGFDRVFTRRVCSTAVRGVGLAGMEIRSERRDSGRAALPGAVARARAIASEIDSRDDC
jgi:hypothetical protein